jgi:hypothetical protein
MLNALDNRASSRSARRGGGRGYPLSGRQEWPWAWSASHSTWAPSVDECGQMGSGSAEHGNVALGKIGLRSSSTAITCALLLSADSAWQAFRTLLCSNGCVFGREGARSLRPAVDGLARGRARGPERCPPQTRSIPTSQAATHLPVRAGGSQAVGHADPANTSDLPSSELVMRTKTGREIDLVCQGATGGRPP